MTEQTQGRVVSNVGMLDWRSMADAEQLAGIAGIENVGTILIPEDLAGALAAIPTKNVGMVMPIPRGANVSVQAGQVRMSGESLASGPEDGILILLGQAIFTSPVTKVGYKELRLAGQLFAPRGSEAALGGKLTQVAGQVIYYTAGPDVEVRNVTGNERIDAGLLEALPHPIVLIATGNTTFADDVTPELLRAKIASMVLIGNTWAPRELAGAVKALAVERIGNTAIYPKGARMIDDEESLGPEDFEYLPDGGALAISGELTLEQGVTAEMVKAKIREIVLYGELRAPRALLPLLRSLTTERHGELVALEDEAASEE